MSAQVKKAIEELKAYLGRDTAGQEKLKAIKDVTGELQKQRARAIEEAATATRLVDAMQLRVNAAESPLNELRSELVRLRQHVANLEAKVARHEAEKNAGQQEDDDRDEEVSDEKKAILKTIKRLRKRMSHCPHLDPVKFDGRKTGRVDRECLSDGWDDDAIWQLGASVALLLLFEGRLILTAQRTLIDVDLGENRGEHGVSRHFVQWLSKNLSKDDQLSREAAEFYAKRDNALLHGSKIPESLGF